MTQAPPPSSVTPYRTPASAIAFLVVLLALVAFDLFITFAYGGGFQSLLFQMLAVLLFFAFLGYVSLFLGPWPRHLGPIMFRCPSCGRTYPERLGAYCPMDGTKLTSMA